MKTEMNSVKTNTVARMLKTMKKMAFPSEAKLCGCIPREVIADAAKTTSDQPSWLTIWNRVNRLAPKSSKLKYGLSATRGASRGQSSLKGVLPNSPKHEARLTMSSSSLHTIKRPLNKFNP